jgi:transcriptional regulator with XRE-family HTH domain
MRNAKVQKKLLRTLGLRIRRFREARDWSQEELSFRCGLHRTYVGSVERGERNISVINLQKIAGALGIEIRDLFAPNEK